MSHLRWCCAAALATVALGAADRAARAQTCTLELKRLEATSGKDLRAGPQQERPYRSVSSQSFTMQAGGGYPPDAEAEFRRIVKKEPAKYVSQEPFRSVARLGTGRFAFVLDAKDEKSKGYDRLYFDLNGNGDLTDDKPIDAVADRSPRAVGQPGYTYHQFPRADLSIPVEGKSRPRRQDGDDAVRSAVQAGGGGQRGEVGGGRRGQVVHVAGRLRRRGG